MRCTLTFLTPQGRKWSVAKTFKDEDHKQNFINKLQRERGFVLDEVYH